MAAMTASHRRSPVGDASSWSEAARCTPKLLRASPSACQSWSSAMAAAPGCETSRANARDIVALAEVAFGIRRCGSWQRRGYRKTMSRAKEHRQAYSAVFVCRTSAHEYHLGIKRGYQRSESVSPKYRTYIDRKVLIEKEFDLLVRVGGGAVWKMQTREVEVGVTGVDTRQSITREVDVLGGNGDGAGGVFSPVGGARWGLD